MFLEYFILKIWPFLFIVFKISSEPSVEALSQTKKKPYHDFSPSALEKRSMYVVKILLYYMLVKLLIKFSVPSFKIKFYSIRRIIQFICISQQDKVLIAVIYNYMRYSIGDENSLSLFKRHFDISSLMRFHILQF